MGQRLPESLTLSGVINDLATSSLASPRGDNIVIFTSWLRLTLPTLNLHILKQVAQ